MSDEDVKAELERLRRENAALKKGASSGIRLKVSEKGAVSVYGMGRFPVTLYKEQWVKLLDMADDIRAFIAANDAQLKAPIKGDVLAFAGTLEISNLVGGNVKVRSENFRVDSKAEIDGTTQLQGPNQAYIAPGAA